MAPNAEKTPQAAALLAGACGGRPGLFDADTPPSDTMFQLLRDGKQCPKGVCTQSGIIPKIISLTLAGLYPAGPSGSRLAPGMLDPVYACLWFISLAGIGASSALWHASELAMAMILD